MKILKSLCLTFAMYSKIPMPRVSWNRENMRYSLCFLPLVGAAVSAVFAAWFWLCSRLGIGAVLRAAVAAVIPLIVTGGIHADGFIDTCDALSSYGGRERKLEILKDPHVGAFGIIGAIAYYLLYFGLLSEIKTCDAALIAASGFIMSRSVCAASIAVMRRAKNSGMLFELSSAANKTAAIAVNVLILAVCAYVMLRLNIITGAMVIFVLFLVCLYYRRMVYGQFGGITGDTCGWFIQTCELAVTAAAVLGGILF